MSNNDLNLNLLKVIEKFELDYKETLNTANVDEKTFNTLYNLGADMKHALDSFKDEIVNHLENK